MEQLRVSVTDPVGTHDYVFTQFPVVFGRLPGLDVRIRDRLVSRLHAQIRCEGEVIVVHDMGAAHGTMVLGGTARHELRDRAIYRAHSRTVEMEMGDSYVRATLERRYASLVPAEVVAAAESGGKQLRRLRGASGAATMGALPGSSFHVLESMRQSVREVRAALQVEVPAALGLDDARTALLSWTYELMNSLSHVTNEIDRVRALERFAPVSPTQLLERLADRACDGLISIEARDDGIDWGAPPRW